MNSLFTAFLSGCLFTGGLVLSGMTNPRKVVGFLDVTGNWDPTLAFVMGGAVTVYFIFQRIILKRAAPLLEPKFHLPTRKDIDVPLLLGAALFGIGWGLSGYCPGPALVSLPGQQHNVWIFVFSMLAGMALFQFILSRRISGTRKKTQGM